MDARDSETPLGSEGPSEQWLEYQGAPTSTDRECAGWCQEAAFRLLNTNPDPEVAEDPENLVVYAVRTGRPGRGLPPMSTSSIGS